VAVFAVRWLLWPGKLPVASEWHSSNDTTLRLYIPCFVHVTSKSIGIDCADGVGVSVNLVL
jgi:hypothetical protein